MVLRDGEMICKKNVGIDKETKIYYIECKQNERWRLEMELYLGMGIDELNKNNAYNTAKEIASQPMVWEKTYSLFIDAEKELVKFINGIFEKNELSVVLTGAGTSAFIGEALEGPFQQLSGKTVRAIATTDLVTHPHLYLHKDKPTLLVSFARSGNSPESVKAVKIADDLCEDIYHLIITCNANGELASLKEMENSFVFLLPPESDDKSLVMTSSFTSMLLSGILIADINSKTIGSKDLSLLQSYAKVILSKYLQELKKASELLFDRSVFLGSGLFKGIAEESQLKLQELTDGEIVCKHDSFLGFRHGPKAVIDEKTLLVFLFSNDSYSQQYEKDLVGDINAGEKGIFRLGVMENDIDVDVNLKVVLSDDAEKINEALLALVSILPTQILAFFKAMNLGLTPDNPSTSGTITRVVQGVKLYSHDAVVS
jgi:tagatose-6-phosphate ketose/aldose isomerase